jgi:SAM-dependent methyltransferase
MSINDKFFLESIQEEFVFKDNRLFFLRQKEDDIAVSEFQSGINRLKTFLKKNPAFYNFLTKVISVELFAGFTAKKAIKMTYGWNINDKIIINLGSGVIRLHPGIINLDMYPFKNVDIVADARSLPFKDGSVDMIIAESLLEHVFDSERVIGEIQRVLKPGGYVWTKVPFMYPFHASPNDYRRWTHEGIKISFDKITPIRAGVFSGPITAVLAIIAHLLALFFSFGSKKIHPFLVSGFMAVLSPLKLLDLIFRIYPSSIESAGFIYFFGKKQ